MSHEIVSTIRELQSALDGLATEDMVIELAGPLVASAEGDRIGVRAPFSRYGCTLLCNSHTLTADGVRNSRHNLIEFNGQRFVVIDRPVVDAYVGDAAAFKFHNVIDLEIYSPLFRHVGMKHNEGDPSTPVFTSRDQVVSSQCLNGDVDTMLVTASPSITNSVPTAISCSGHIFEHVDYVSCRRLKMWRNATFSNCGSIISPAITVPGSKIIMSGCRVVGRPKILHSRGGWFSGPFLFVPPGVRAVVIRCVFKGDQHGSLYRGYACAAGSECEFVDNDYSQLTVAGPFHSHTGIGELTWSGHIDRNGFDGNSIAPREVPG